MARGHSKATVTVDFEGLGLMCINRDKTKAEVGLLTCGRHKPVLDIQKIELDNAGRAARSYFHDSFIPDRHVWFNVGPQSPPPGISTYKPTGEFQRGDPRSDEEDFRWIPDLEGPEFHNTTLTINPSFERAPRFFLFNAEFYTKRRTDHELSRVSLNSSPSRRDLGRLAYNVSADIILEKNGFLTLSDRPIAASQELSDDVKRLEYEPSIKYLITVQNHCSVPGDFDGTDFRLYYDVVADPRGVTFDLRRIVPRHSRFLGAPADTDRQEYAADGYPENCAMGLLGRHDGFGPEG